MNEMLPFSNILCVWWEKEREREGKLGQYVKLHMGKLKKVFSKID